MLDFSIDLYENNYYPIKLSPLIPILDREFEHKIIHTGQHYDYNMDEIFFEELQLRKPDYPLCIGSHPAGKQTGLMLEKIEEVLLQEKPDLVHNYRTFYFKKKTL